MKEIYQIPRISLTWILASLVAVILPHVARMPLWLTALCGACVAARVLIHQGRLSWPGSRIKILVVSLTVGAVVLQFGRDVFSTEATVGVLIVGIALKLLEMQQKRDVLLVIYLCYFTVVAEFIYSQSIPIALYMAVCVLLITAGLLSLHQNREGQDPRRTARLAGVMLVQSVPVMLALFLLFPRISPLWAVPLQRSSGTTGLSESMSPGDIGQLTRSGEVVFRVQFQGDMPAPGELYWRGLTLDLFDGREWSRRRGGFDDDAQFLGANPRRSQDWFLGIEYLDRPVDYDVILEPSRQNWIFTLKIPQITDDELRMRDDFQVESFRSISQRFKYQARSWLTHRVGLEPEPDNLRRALRLPDAGNQASRDLAARMRAQAAGELDYINAVLALFREQEFFYTATPGVLGGDPVDEFLFDSRQGFCEHYAGAFTFLMRAAGIPARVVTGYQGGEVNPFDGTLTVRQYDAHAWSEVWLEGRGWVRFDPTAMVAPERINLGSDAALQSQEGFLGNSPFSLLRFRNNLLLNDLRLRLESIDYAWNRWVLNYDQELQLELFSRLFRNVTGHKILLSMMGLITLTVLAVAWVVLRKPARAARHPATALYLRYCRLLARLGLHRQPGETPRRYCSRVSAQRPELAGEVGEITRTYEDLVYRPLGPRAEEERLKELRRLVRRFRLLKGS